MSTKASTHQTTDYVEDKAHEAVDRAGKASDYVEGKAHDAVNRAAKSTGKAEEYTREQASHADERVRAAATHGRKQAEEMFGSVNGYVRDNPLISIAIAFGAGVLLSSLRRRR